MPTKKQTTTIELSEATIETLNQIQELRETMKTLNSNPLIKQRRAVMDAVKDIQEQEAKLASNVLDEILSTIK